MIGRKAQARLFIRILRAVMPSIAKKYGESEWPPQRWIFGWRCASYNENLIIVGSLVYTLNLFWRYKGFAWLANALQDEWVLPRVEKHRLPDKITLYLFRYANCKQICCWRPLLRARQVVVALEALKRSAAELLRRRRHDKSRPHRKPSIRIKGDGKRHSFSLSMVSRHSTTHRYYNGSCKIPWRQ